MTTTIALTVAAEEPAAYRARPQGHDGAAAEPMGSAAAGGEGASVAAPGAAVAGASAGGASATAPAAGLEAALAQVEAAIAALDDVELGAEDDEAIATASVGLHRQAARLQARLVEVVGVPTGG